MPPVLAPARIRSICTALSKTSFRLASESSETAATDNLKPRALYRTIASCVPRPGVRAWCPASIRCVPPSSVRPWSGRPLTAHPRVAAARARAARGATVHRHAWPRPAARHARSRSVPADLSLTVHRHSSLSVARLPLRYPLALRRSDTDGVCSS